VWGEDVVEAAQERNIIGLVHEPNSRTLAVTSHDFKHFVIGEIGVELHREAVCMRNDAGGLERVFLRCCGDEPCWKATQSFRSWAEVAVVIRRGGGLSFSRVFFVRTWKRSLFLYCVREVFEGRNGWFLSERWWPKTTCTPVGSNSFRDVGVAKIRVKISIPEFVGGCGSRTRFTANFDGTNAKIRQRGRKNGAYDIKPNIHIKTAHPRSLSVSFYLFRFIHFPHSLSQSLLVRDSVSGRWGKGEEWDLAKYTVHHCTFALYTVFYTTSPREIINFKCCVQGGSVQHDCFKTTKFFYLRSAMSYAALHFSINIDLEYHLKKL